MLRWCFYAMVVRPLTWIVLGLNVRHGERLPNDGPVILVANHNSHLDTMVLISLFPLGLLPKLRPVAAADYFLSNRFMAWFSLNIIGIIPVTRGGGSADPLQGASEAVGRGDLVILFPEGSRGEPERLNEFKKGVWHLAKRHPNVPILPVFLHGLGKALPRGEALLVPFFCDVFVGEAMGWSEDWQAFMAALSARMAELIAEGQFPPWE
jgi:1-acyl-sn-glycerol-3-phosphate acyltransferase